MGVARGEEETLRIPAREERRGEHAETQGQLLKEITLSLLYDPSVIEFQKFI